MGERNECATMLSRALQVDHEAAQLERERQARHHDVLCLVLKELVAGSPSGKQQDVGHGVRVCHVEVAREYADLAYPPPKAE